MRNEKRAPSCWGFIGDEKLHSYIRGLFHRPWIMDPVMNNQDSTETTVFFRGSNVLGCSLSQGFVGAKRGREFLLQLKSSFTLRGTITYPTYHLFLWAQTWVDEFPAKDPVKGSLEGRFKLKLAQSMELCEFVMKHPPIQKDKLNLVTSLGSGPGIPRKAPKGRGHLVQ